MRLLKNRHLHLNCLMKFLRKKMLTHLLQKNHFLLKRLYHRQCWKSLWVLVRRRLALAQ